MEYLRCSKDAVGGMSDEKLEIVKCQTIEGHFSSIENKINNSTNYWKGEAGEAHRRVYQESKEGIEEVLNDFRQTAENLRTIAGNYENTEKTVVAEAQGLLVDVIE